MKTLYDLLEALPTDGADELRSAFRRAVKGCHPDIRPGDPEAALKFRLIVNAHDILRDPDQRAAYDHLLTLAETEQEEIARPPLIRRIQTFLLASASMVGGSAATVMAYMLFAHAPAAAPAASHFEALTRGSAEIAAVTMQSPWVAPDWVDLENLPDKDATRIVAAAPPPAALPKPEIAEATETAPAPEPYDESNPSATMRAKGIAAYRSGDLDTAMASFDRAIQLNRKFVAAYIDRSIVLYRLGQYDRAFADLARAKRLDHGPARADARPAAVRPIARPRARPEQPTQTARVAVDNTPRGQASLFLH